MMKFLLLYQMKSSQKPYDLEERTYLFACNVRDLCFKIAKNEVNRIYITQLVRSSSSPGANYIEANESLGEKDFLMKIRICRKESKETEYWLKLIKIDNCEALNKEKDSLINESKELVKIFSAIIKSRTNKTF